MNDSSKELTVSSTTANIISIIVSLLLVPLMVLPYKLVWGFTLSSFLKSAPPNLKYVLIIFIIGTIIHELIHGVTAAWYVGIGWHNIRFGIQWNSLTPYCHSKIPMSALNYRYVVIMPLVVLGIIPYIAAIFSGSGWLLTVGIIFTIAAAGDVMIYWMMRKLKKETTVQDHPTKVGLLIPD